MIRFLRTLRPRPLPLRLRHSAALALLVYASACSKPEPADVVEIIGAAPSCTGCRVELGPPLELRSDNGSEPVLATSPTAITIDGLGRYWVAQMRQLARVYDANGKFLRTLGRKGGGPNEYDSPIAFMPLPGDSMLVFDFRQQAFVVDSQFRVARTLHMPGVLMPASADGWPSRVLLSGPIKAPASEGWTLHAVSAEQADVKVVRSFGHDSIPSALGGTMASYQRVTPSKDGTYWSADILRYRISHFAKDGTLIGTIERAPEWFRVPSPNNMGTPTVPPPPTIFAIWQAPDGLLWVFGRVAGKNWKDGWPKLAPGATEVDVSALRSDKMFGTMIEVLDPISRNVVSSAPLDDFVSDVLPNGNVAVFAVDSAGVPHLSIRRLSLTR